MQSLKQLANTGVISQESLKFRKVRTFSEMITAMLMLKVMLEKPESEGKIQISSQEISDTLNSWSDTQSEKQIGVRELRTMALYLDEQRMVVRKVAKKIKSGAKKERNRRKGK